MKKTIYVCEGNVGRSQMAEGFHNHLTGDNLAMSAGVNNVGSKYDFVPREDIVMVMRERGVNISAQRIKQLTEEMLRGGDTVIVLCDPEILPEFVRRSGLDVLIRKVGDPDKCNIEGVRKIRDQVEAIVLEYIDS